MCACRKFAVGYQLADFDEPERFPDIVADYKSHIAEVYFPWLNMASGRSSLGSQRGCVDWSAQGQLEEDLIAIRKMGVKLDILFNANCYGSRAVSRHLENQVGSLLEYLHQRIGGVDVVTTTSPFVARCVKTHFPHIETRASVNMRIGTIQAMEMMADLFDSYYIQRDGQRNIKHLEHAHKWAKGNGNKLCLLVNSGCLRNCPSQTFHDNLVAHEADIAETANVNWNPILCRRLMAEMKNRPSVLKSTWIRPEDLDNYEPFVDVIKLATRMHPQPRLVLDAYTKGKYNGNLLDLFEPAFSADFAPNIIDNGQFPGDWFDRTSTCDGKCELCSYCNKTFEKLLRTIKDNMPEINQH